VLLAISALVPSASAQTVGPGFKVWIWAPVLDPVELTAGPDGSLYVGRDLSGSGGGTGDPTRIRRISSTAVVTEFGPSLDDPDVVWFDAAGVPGSSAGSILVGGRDDGVLPLQGRVTAIAPDESASVVFGPSTVLPNPTGFTSDALGQLLLTDFDTGDLSVLSAGSLTTLINGPARGASDILRHAASGELYVSWGDGFIRRYTAAGVLIDGAFASGRAMEFGPGNATFGSDLYTVNNTTGELLRVDGAKNVTTLGTGFQDVMGLNFGSDGALYLTEFSRDRVMRVSCLPVPGEVNNLTLSHAGGGVSILLTWDDVPGAADYVVFQHGVAAGPFTTQTGPAASGVTGLTTPVPAGKVVYFQVGGRDACGVGVLN
jgi:sugar lactone lactonase YvrE